METVVILLLFCLIWNTARVNELKSCTSGQCEWVQTGKTLKLSKTEYGKQQKVYPALAEFEPRSRTSDNDVPCKIFREGLEKVCSEAVALHVLPHPQACPVSEEILQPLITMEENVESVEEVEAVEISSIFEIRDDFISSHSLDPANATSPDSETISQFFEAITLSQEQAQRIFEKTKSQGETEFWKTQGTGKVTGSNFYKICHLRDSTNKDNTLKELFNYCPLPADKQPQQFQWGHENEKTAIEYYIKKIHKKHKGLRVENSGLIINVFWPHLGANPDGIRYCDCCERRVVEVKSLFAKRNLSPHIAAAEYITKVNGQYTLKTETRWYYQIQGELTTTGCKVADLIIYTNKGILVIEVEFDEAFWKAILQKLTAFYKMFMILELLTKRLLHLLS